MPNVAVYNLLKHPDKLQKCYQEVDSVLGDNAMELEHIPRLKYLWATMRETLRYLGPISSISRHSKRETVIGGRYRIQPDWVVMLNLRGCHHDAGVYGADADVFRPERFLEGGWEQNPPNAWKAFGTGARGCPGKAIAEQEMITAWALILQRFNIELADPEYQLKIKSTLTIKPDDLRFKVRRRPGKDRVGRPKVFLFCLSLWLILKCYRWSDWLVRRMETRSIPRQARGKQSSMMLAKETRMTKVTS